MLAKVFKRNHILHFFPKYYFAEGATFLQMVESFFDRAAVHTGIRTDRLVFYKKAENVVKCSIPLVKGIPFPIKMTGHSRLSLPIAASTRLTSCQPKVGLALHKMWILKKCKLWPV